MAGVVRAVEELVVGVPGTWAEDGVCGALEKDDDTSDEDEEGWDSTDSDDSVNSVRVYLDVADLHENFACKPCMQGFHARFSCKVCCMQRLHATPAYKTDRKSDDKTLHENLA